MALGTAEVFLVGRLQHRETAFHDHLHVGNGIEEAPGHFRSTERLPFFVGNILGTNCDQEVPSWLEQSMNLDEQFLVPGSWYMEE